MVVVLPEPFTPTTMMMLGLLAPSRSSVLGPPRSVSSCLMALCSSLRMSSPLFTLPRFMLFRTASTTLPDVLGPKSTDCTHAPCYSPNSCQARSGAAHRPRCMLACTLFVALPETLRLDPSDCHAASSIKLLVARVVQGCNRTTAEMECVDSKPKLWGQV